MLDFLIQYNILLRQFKWSNDILIITTIYTLLLIFVSYAGMPSFFYYFIIPIIIINIYDLIFNYIYSLFIRNSLNIINRQINFDFLFNFNQQNEIRENTIIFALPLTVNRNNNRYYNILERRIIEYLWLCRFYQNHAITRYYLLPFIIIIFHTSFFLIMYIFYFNFNNCIYLFAFLLLWLFYAIYSIEDILNLRKYSFYFRNFRNNINYRQFFRHLNILNVNNRTITELPLNSFIEIEQAYDKEYKQKMDFIIGFISTVIFISLLTFMVSNPNNKCTINNNNKELNNSYGLNKICKKLTNFKGVLYESNVSSTN